MSLKESNVSLVESVEDHVYDLFSRSYQKGSLGYISREKKLSVSVLGRHVEAEQLISMLHANHSKGTTGAVAWQVSPVFARWLLQERVLCKQDTVVELGCGATALLACLVGPEVACYYVTDLKQNLKLAQANIERNVAGQSISVAHLDWEDPDVSVLSVGAVESQRVWLLAADTVYNLFLIPHFIGALEKLFSLFDGKEVQALVAQQIKDNEVMTEYLQTLVERGFKVSWASIYFS